MLTDRFDEFKGEARANCWWSGFHPTGEYDPSLGYGCVLLGSDGLPAVQVWVHVDDFLIHCPTLAKTQSVLRLFLDLVVDCGMLCHPRKLTKPQHVVKYCGFMINMVEEPHLCIPVGKREKVLAMVEHVLGSPNDRSFSRLGLSMIAGTLEAVTNATPACWGILTCTLCTIANILRM